MQILVLHLQDMFFCSQPISLAIKPAVKGTPKHSLSLDIFVSLPPSLPPSPALLFFTWLAQVLAINPGLMKDGAIEYLKAQLAIQLCL